MSCIEQKKYTILLERRLIGSGRWRRERQWTRQKIASLPKAPGSPLAIRIYGKIKIERI